MVADATLMAILTGGVFAYGDVGIDGITRETAASAFDANGYLKTCSLVKQRGAIPDRQVTDTEAQLESIAQVVEIYVYQRRGYDQIDLALARLFSLFYGYRFADSGELARINTLDRLTDQGVLKNASLARVDWLVNSVQGA